MCGDGFSAEGGFQEYEFIITLLDNEGGETPFPNSVPNGRLNLLNLARTLVLGWI
jgi:hypothetical protein